jgi:hypothetical protein
MAAKRPTAAQIRDRRSKIAAIVLSVVFLGVAAIQGPKLLKMVQGGGSGSSTPAADTTTTPGVTGTATPGTGTPGTSTPGTATTAAGVGAGPSQLNRFTLFPAQMPFRTKPQPPVPVTGGAGTTTTGPTSTTPAPSPKAAKTTTAATTTTATTTPAAKAATTPAAPAPPVTFTVPNGVPAALVTVNGKKQLFGAGAQFPREAPLFTLASIGKKGLKIRVLGGSFVDGQNFLVLRAGNKVTLLNQSDGTKFVIRYVKKTFAPADELTSPTATSSAATTPAATTTTG